MIAARGTKSAIEAAFSTLFGCRRVTVEERRGAVVVRCDWQPHVPVGDVRDAIRDVARASMPAGVAWIVVVNGSLVVRPAAHVIYPIRPFTFQVGDQVGVYNAGALDDLARRGLSAGWYATHIVNRVLWWRRRDLHRVTRVTAEVVECERLRWSWATWSWVIDWTPTALELEVTPCPE